VIFWKKIDFVITWVDSNDEDWLLKKNKFSKDRVFTKSQAGDNRYRDYGTLKYLFRSIEQYASWVNNIFLVTDGQRPNWLQTNGKVKVIDHKEIIDKKYLPTFNSNAIELNVHKIPGLSDHFVLFNDDFILNRVVKPEDFFVHGRPVDAAIFSPIFPESDFDRIRLNNVIPINNHFSKKVVEIKNPLKIFNFKYGRKNLNNIILLPFSRFTGFLDFHIPTAYTKSEFETVWLEEEKLLSQTVSHKFRENTDVSHWLIRYWRLMTGDFSVQKLPFGKYFYLSQIELWSKELSKGKIKVMCINDEESMSEFEYFSKELNRSLQTKFSKTSIFERKV